MENLVEKLQSIVSDYKLMENASAEDISKLKQREFDLFGEIKSIRELAEYYKTDMIIDKMPEMFINGMYSGVVNGSMFVINKLIEVVKNEKGNIPDSISKKLDEIQGID